MAANLTEDEEDKMLESLGDYNAMLLINHGIIVGARTIGEAFHSVYMLERACQIHMQLRSMNRNIVIPDPEICERTAKTFSADFEEGIVDLAWQGGLSIISNQYYSYSC